MKKSNRLSVKVLALLMTFVMLFSFSATVFAVNSEVASTEYYTISYNSESDVPEIVVSVDVGALATYLANGNFKKEDLKKFFPEFVAEILSTKTMPSVSEIIDFIPDEVLTKSELGKIIPSNLLKKYLTADLIEKVLPKSEWANVLPINEVIDEEEIAYVMETYPAIAEALVTDDVLVSLMKEDVIKAIVSELEPGSVTIDSTASDILAMVGPDKVIEVIGMDVIIDAIDVNAAIATILAKADSAYIARIADMVIASPSFDFAKLLKAVDVATLKAEIKGIFVKVLLNDVDSADLLYYNEGDASATIFAYNSETYSLELDLEALSDALLLAMPDSTDLAEAGNGETFFAMGLGMNFVGDSNTYGCKVSVEFAGDTSVLSQYTNKLAQTLNYSVMSIEGDAYGMIVNVSDFSEDSFVSFADIMRNVLASEVLTDAQKAEIFQLFTKEGQEFLNAFEALDFNSAVIDAKYVPYLEQIRSAMMNVLEKAIESSSVDYTTISFADLYDAVSKQFILNDIVTIPTGELVEMLCEKVGYSVDELQAIVGEYTETITYGLTLTLAMNDVYRVRYFDNNGKLLYTTFLPSETDLSIINNNTEALNGMAGEYGWADKNGEIVTVTPYADVDLYPANEIAADTFIATFVADGKVVAKIPFKAGDKKLVGVPMVPEKTGYHGKWENYKLGNENITIKAIYTEKTYTVIYNANGGEGTMTNQILTYDKETALNACTFTRDGYTFIGWNTKADGTGTSYADKQIVKNMTLVDGVILYAQWQAVAPTVHTVTFMANGTVVDKVTFNEGETELSRVPEVPARAGYVGAWEAYTLTNVDITVNAEYTANEYVVVFNANGGEGDAMANQTMTYDTFAALSANTYTYAGYVFAGWNTAADGTGASYADGENVKNLAESGEVTLFAQWTEEVEETEETTTATEETTTAPIDDEEGGFNWIVLVIVIAVLAIAGGVAGFLVYKKKKSV